MKLLRALMIIAVGAFWAGSTGCDDSKPTGTTTTTTDVQVKDKLLGGKEVKKTEVIEQGDKSQVRESKTELNEDGTVKERKVEVKGDDLR